MSALDELPLSTSSYLADTQHLSLPQHGAYLLILMTMWRAGGWIDDDERKLATICKTSVKKWRQIAVDVRALLIVRDGKLSQKRLLSEVEIVLNMVARNRENGSAGGKAKSLKSQQTDLAPATVSLGDRQNGPDSALPSLLTDSDSKKGRKKGRGGIQLPADWKPSPDDIQYGIDLEFGQRAIEGMAEDMRLWAGANANRAVARKDGPKGWSLTFKGWMRREAAKRKPKTRNGGPTMFDIASGDHRRGDNR